MRIAGSQLAKGLVIFTGGLVLALGLLIMVREATMITNWSRSGFVLCAINPRSDTTVTFYEVDPLDFAAPPIPAAGDTLLTLNDSTATPRRWIDLLERPHTPGREVAATFLHKGVEQQTTFRTRPVQVEMKIGVFMLQGLKILIFLSFVIVGFWAFIRRPHSAGVRTLALYCFAMATFMMRTPMPMYREMASFTIPWEPAVRLTLVAVGGFFSSHWLLLHLLFPRPRRLMRERPTLAYALAYAPALFLIVVTTVASLGIRPEPRWLFLPWLVVFGTQVLAGSWLLLRHYRRAKDNLERRQTKLVLYGSVPGLLLFLLYLVRPIGILSGLFDPPWMSRLFSTNIVFAVLLLSPVTFAYAFGKYRLLEVEGRLRRGTRYLLVTAVLLGLFFAVVYLVGELLLHNLQITSRAPTLLVALVLALGFTPAHRSIQQQIETYFYPERRRLRTMVNEFLRTAFALPDRDALCQELEARLRRSLGIASVQLWLSDHPPVSSNGLFAAQGEFMTVLRRKGHPVLVDEAFASDHVCCTTAEGNWLESHGVALVLPLATHEGLQGFLALGHKPGREDYDPEELQILERLADQVALAVENQKLLEENLEKRRMEEELQVARRVQERFLPKEVPPTPGLEIAAHSTFCLEIAGDYYDIVPLTDGRTLLAVGDVSGKGAGAALIMANLQAALRALCGLELSLAELTARINMLIYQNTEPDQFITLFVGVFDSRTRQISYVNAGHNAPYLLRADGECETLEVGGLLLGAFPGVGYNMDTRPLGRGDTLILYTDGISEAMNGAGEELGEARMCSAAGAALAASPAAVLQAVKELVAAHQGRSDVEDDQTLLVAKVL